MTVSIGVVGASGYAGGEVLRLLLSHPRVLSGEASISRLCAASSAGSPMSEHQPHLPQLAGRIIEETTPEILADCDVVFLGLPHGYSAQLASQLPQDTLVIDLGADFRLKDKNAWDEYYGGTYAGSWPYGIPELPGAREQLAQASRISAPGCFPTGASIALAPLIASGRFSSDIVIVSVTGTSGAGKGASVALLGSEVMGSAKAYGVATHRHTPEIIQNLQSLTDKKVSVSFTPVLAPMSRGILTTATVHTDVSGDELRDLYEQAYADEPFVQVIDGQPMTSSVVGSNNVQIGLVKDERTSRAVITCAIDNLTKGTAGGAIQSMNIALGWPEATGLPVTGVAP